MSCFSMECILLHNIKTESDSHRQLKLGKEWLSCRATWRREEARATRLDAESNSSEELMFLPQSSDNRSPYNAHAHALPSLPLNLSLLPPTLSITVFLDLPDSETPLMLLDPHHAAPPPSSRLCTESSRTALHCTALHCHTSPLRHVLPLPTLRYLHHRVTRALHEMHESLLPPCASPPHLSSIPFACLSLSPGRTMHP